MYRVLVRAAMILVIGSQVGLGQQVTVRLVNAKTGRPFLTKNRKIEMWSYDSMPSITNRSMNKVHPDLRAVEGPDGEATFQLPRPVPPVICANPEIPIRSIIICADTVCFWTGKVLRRGAVPANKCDPKGKLKMKPSPKPGEIIVFVRRYTFWDTL